MVAQTATNVGPLGVPAIASLIRGDLALTLAQAGSFQSMYYIGPSLISLPAGTLVDRWGVKRMLVPRAGPQDAAGSGRCRLHRVQAADPVDRRRSLHPWPRGPHGRFQRRRDRLEPCSAHVAGRARRAPGGRDGGRPRPGDLLGGREAGASSSSGTSSRPPEATAGRGSACRRPWLGALGILTLAGERRRAL